MASEPVLASASEATNEQLASIDIVVCQRLRSLYEL